MRAGGAGVISGRSSAYPEVYAALGRDPAVQERLDRIVALGASIGRLKHALQVRGLAGSPAARMTVDPPDPGAGRRDRGRGRRRDRPADSLDPFVT